MIIGLLVAIGVVLLVVESCAGLAGVRADLVTRVDVGPGPRHLRRRCRSSWARSTPSAIALLIATPIGVLTAIFLSEFAPRRVATPLTFTIELLAAIPRS